MSKMGPAMGELVFWIGLGGQKKPIQFAGILRRGVVSGGFGKGCRSGAGRMG